MSGKKAKPITKVVVVNDLHIWSTVGLWPAGFISVEGVPIGQNEFQKITWDCWLKLWGQTIPSLMRGDPFLLIVNGDVIEGKHHNSVELMSADPDDQWEAVMKAFEPCGHSAIAFTEGTECHTRNFEHIAAQKLGGIKDPNTGRPAHAKLFLDIAGLRLIARHHMPTSSIPWGESRALKAEFDKETVSAAMNKETAPNVLLLAHRHVYGEYRCANGLAICCPAWQGLTRHGRKVVPHAHGATPGAVVLDFANLRQDGTPTTEPIIFRAKPAKSVRI
jgi:hypothetical protein